MAIKTTQEAPDVDDAAEDSDVDSDALDDEQDDGKVFSEQEVNTREKKLRQSYQKRLAAEKKKLEKAQADALAKFEEFESKMAALEEKLSVQQQATEDADTQAEADESKRMEKKFLAQLESLESKYQTQVDALQTRLQAAEAREKAAEQNRREADRDAQLQAALSDIGVVDSRGGVRYHLPQISWHDDLGEWQYETDDGDHIGIREAVSQFTPDYLKAAKVRSGTGSNQAGGANVPKSGKRKQLDMEMAKLEDMQKEVEKIHRETGRFRTDLVVKFQQQQRKVASLKEELTGTE